MPSRRKTVKGLDLPRLGTENQQLIDDLLA
jgi:hypothetical protein